VVPGVTGATALTSVMGTACALTGKSAVCWGGESAFPFTVPLPAKTTQIALGVSLLPSNIPVLSLGALDDSGLVWIRPLLANAADPAVAPEFVKSAVLVKQLVGGGEGICTIGTNGDLSCPVDGQPTTIASKVELAVQGTDGSLCYKTGGELYCSAKPDKGSVVAGNGSAVGVAVVNGTGCALNDAGKLACWAEGGPTTVTDAAEVALGASFGCVLHKTGKISCWGDSDGGQLGNGQQRPGLAAAEPTDVSAGPTPALPAFVLLTDTPLGACDTWQDLSAITQTGGMHARLAGCKAMCATRLDANDCFAGCAMPGGLSNACLACYVGLATCQGPDCYAAFQTCAGYPVDFAKASNDAPRFECTGAKCLHGKSVGQPCTDGSECLTGACSSLKQAPDAKVCTAADGASCYESSSFCDCDMGQDAFGDSTHYGYCGDCYAEGRVASQAHDCYRSCTGNDSYCYPGQMCKNFSDGNERYCD
jgi:hypothetical protein